IGNPADGPYVLDVVRRTGGIVADVSDAEGISAIRVLAATEGVFGETAGGVTLGVLRPPLAQGHLHPRAGTGIMHSGDGLKTLDAIGLTGVGPDGVLPGIRPTLAAFEAWESSQAVS